MPTSTRLTTRFRCALLPLMVVGWLMQLASVQAQESDPLNFSRDIRPILSDKCFKCHGPDENSRRAGLRLDSRESVFDDMSVVEPGEPEESELYLRLTSDNSYLVMPPPESGKELTDQQIEKVRRWIEQGAEWGDHWSFVPPVKPELPQVSQEDWPKNEIDYFVLHELERRDWQPSDEADRRTLARRAALDLTGLPPTRKQLQAFLKDEREDAWETYVDSLLESPHYGEHMGRYWLDAARYGDTHGLHLDNYREHWPYRDWVIEAFNSNKPWDEFTIEQLAGDLLDDPTRDQLVATGFNRAHVTTNEGGSIKKEVKVRNVIDRTSTFGTVFLGLTVGCAQCHDHKFDPITQKDFYSLYAYFNSLDGNPMDGNVKDHPPVLMVGTDEQMAELKQLDQKIAAVEQQIQEKVAGWEYREPDDPPTVPPQPETEYWIDDQLPEAKTKFGEWRPISGKPHVHRGNSAFVHEAAGNQQYYVLGVEEPWTVHDDDEELFVWVWLDPENPPREIMVQWNNGQWEHRAIWGEDLIDWGEKNSPSRFFAGRLPKLGEWTRLSVRAGDVGLPAGSTIGGVALTQYDGRVVWDAVGKVSYPPPYPPHRSLADWIDEQVRAKGANLPGPLKNILQSSREEWTEQQRQKLRDYFIEKVYSGSRETFDPLHDQRDSLTQRRKELKESIPTTLIYREKPEPDQAYVLNRGQYDQPGEEVQRDVPDSLPSLPDADQNDRLALAKWLLSDSHPLTARVAVNRFWQQCFGTGLVETAGDFGAQGTFPTHPDLLDYLAVDFREGDWDVKRLMKKIVMSATYRQTSKASPDHFRRDPKNRYFARGPRFRLDAEVIRDQALATSGLLVKKLGGPSVKPPQPDGLWFVVGYSGSNTVRFSKDEGHEKVHRRSLYTFWKRTAPPPQMSILDAPSRETCIVRRERTNTPLQALMLMNDPQFVEAARYLAQRTIDEAPSDTESRIQWMFTTCLCRPASQSELSWVQQSANSWKQSFSKDQERARQLIAIGENPADEEAYRAAELATWTMVANLIMNMDEFVTKN